MTAFDEARKNARAYIMADFSHMMGRGNKPTPADYGFSGGNTYTAQGETFMVDALLPPTFPIHAGF